MRTKETAASTAEDKVMEMAPFPPGLPPGLPPSVVSTGPLVVTTGTSGLQSGKKNCHKVMATKINRVAGQSGVLFQGADSPKSVAALPNLASNIFLF